MDLTPYVAALREQLAVAAETGGEEARVLAERLTAPLDSSVRLTLLEALSTAADEITRDLAPGSVEVRLRGRDADFVVTPPPADTPAAEPDAPDAGLPARPDRAAPPRPDAEDGAMTRVNLRLPEQLKARLEQAASREHTSLNAWLVRAAVESLEREEHRPGVTRGRGRHTGWVR